MTARRRASATARCPAARVAPRAAARAAALGATLAVLVAGPAGAQDTGWVIEEFTTAIAVAGDGTLAVTEEITVDFANLERRGIFRVIPARYALGSDEERARVPDGVDPDDVRRAIDIRDISVSSTAPADTEITRPNRFGEHNLQIRIGDPDVTVTGRQSYRITYEVAGALNPADGGAELRWNTTGHDWPVPIQQATTVVSGPGITGAECFSGPVGSTAPCEAGPAGDGRVQFTARGLAPGEGMTAVVGFAPDAVEVPPPMLVEQWDLQRAFVGSPAAIPLALLTALLGLGGVTMLTYRQGRDRVTRGGVTIDGRPDSSRTARAGGDNGRAGGAGGAAPRRRRLFSPWPAPVQYRPPGDLRPAQLGVVVDERVDPVDVSATIVDLAVRGYLTIEEEESGWLRKRKDWTLTRTDKPADDLLDFESQLLSGLFSGKTQVEISELKGTFSSDYEAVCKRLYTDAVARGWFPRSPRATRRAWLAIAIVALVASVGLVVVAALYTTVALAAVPLVVAALALIVVHRWLPHRTPQGSRMLARTLGFREFITTAEAGRMEFAEQENLFETYLPYAVVFGAVDRWASAFAHLGTAAAATGAGVGAWYLSSSGHRDLSSLSEGLSSFSNTVGSSLPTSPPSSSGGGGGGGSSGGGFGGGGGGSW